MFRSRAFLPFAFLSLALAGCGGPAPDDSADNSANAADPALTSALQDQIMVDPQLSRQANSGAVRPPSQPYSGGVPAQGVAANTDTVDKGGLLHAPAPNPATKGVGAAGAITPGALAQRQKDPKTKGCAAHLTYSAGWAQRLPADLPLYPQARVTEAAGTEDGKCRLRIVSFSAAQPMQAMVDWYYTQAIRGGYSAEHQIDGQQHILGGAREKDGSAYMMYLTTRSDGGTDIDLIANNGR
ncbi:hypothetical protein [Sphingomonas sp. dw_22]|uniref:hypothetical protein n=1 Tax=Sphingomonas sp. dw_22 TaxID=2721175 RepID=UPI001BD49291|nr:hypothetical protein [Sphingomonas sp. dw_22]